MNEIEPALDATAAGERLAAVEQRIGQAAQAAGRSLDAVKLVAVGKTFQAGAIEPLIAAGQRRFGENRVQEAQAKWPKLRAKYPDLELHLIGPLQSNKVADAVALFDVIETVDREKIARAIAKEIDRTGKRLQLFVQVNTGEEPQKSGVLPADMQGFVALCRDELDLPIEGLMCIPPLDEEVGLHFALLAKLAARAGLGNLSMGMSADFETAIRFGATHVRIGTALFGPRGQG